MINLQQTLATIKNTRLKAISFLTVAALTSSILGLIKMVILGRGLTKEEFGSFILSSTIISIIDVVNRSGLNQSVLQYTSRQYTGVLKSAIKKRLELYPVILLMGLTMLILGRLMESLYFTGSLLFVATLTYPFTHIAAAVQYYLLGCKRVTAQAILSVITSLGGVITACFAILFIQGENRALWVVGLNGLWLMIIYGCAILVQTDWRQISTSDRFIFQEAQKYGSAMMRVSIISVLQERLDSLLIGFMVGSAILADFSIGILLKEEVKKIWMAFYNVTYPWYVLQDRGSISRIMRGDLASVVIFFGLLIIGILLLVPYVIPFIFGDKYNSGIPYITPILLGLWCALPGAVLEMYFRTHNLMKEQQLLRITYFIAAMTFTPTLIALFGASGAAASRFFLGILFTATAIFIMKKLSQN